MMWLFLALVASIIYSTVAIIDKHAVSDELKDPVFGSVVSSFTLFVILMVSSLALAPLVFSLEVAVPAFLTGVFYVFAIIAAYSSFKRTEISRSIPVMMTSPIFVLVIAAMFLGEVFSPVKYGGMALIVLGAILISIKKDGRKKSGLMAGFAIALVASLMFAFRNIFLKVSATQVSIWSSLFWMGLGGFLVGVVLFAFHHPHIRKKAKRGAEHMIISNFLASAAFVFLTLAMETGFASLVSSVLVLNVLWVFIIATALSRTHTHIIREEMRHSTLLLKGISIVLIIVGMIAIV
jgi:transporter family protein